MSVGGTALAVLFSLPLALLATANSSHLAVHIVSRSILCLLRAVPDLIMGLLFVAAVGFGALPGMLALVFHSTGILGKSFVETIGRVNKESIETIQFTGASSMQIFRYAILPQNFIQITELCVSRWEYNVRMSTIMGIVGAGGIGAELIREMGTRQYQKAFAILLVILMTLVLIDLAGSQLRKHLK
jgi:phosphonate transport system permease protein